LKKAKTNKKFFTIFSAILGVVFAFLTGFTYCATSLELFYGSESNSTAAYIGNQQYHLINDTIKSPVLFGEGAHNFEIALQYSYAYDFDVRLTYSLSWSGGVNYKTDNVILHFVDRDNIIYDQQYIYLANSVSAGSGKISIISGVDYIDPTLESYAGQKLEINISEVRIFKAQTTYLNSNKMISDVVTLNSQTGEITKFNSVAAEAWLQYKKNSTAAENENTNAYVMMYNYRRNYEHGVPYPGVESAYKKPVAISDYGDGDYKQGNVYGSTWTGGNRAYAGTGMYVIAGTDPLELEIQVSGIWRYKDNNQIKDEKNFISENSIQYNYTSDWVLEKYSENNLWEVRTFIHYIPENTACYIEINDSVEIISAGRASSIAYDEYRLVTNSIIINPTLGENKTTFTYTELSSDYAQFKSINKYNVQSTTTEYVKDNVSVMNMSLYSNGLYNTFNKGQQSYNTNINLINNTAQSKMVQVDLELWYHISNGQTLLYDTSNNNLRASQLIGDDKDYKFQDAFNSANNKTAVNTLYYTYSQKVDYLQGTKTFKVKIEPYSSFNLLTSFAVQDGLNEHIVDTFDDPTTNADSQTSKFIEKYDVWTYLVPKVKDADTFNDSSLTLETTQKDGKTIVSVKNNTNSKITGISLTNFSFRKLDAAVFTQETSPNKPSDWDSNYWQYYKEQNKESQITTPGTTYEPGFYKMSQSYSNIEIDAETTIDPETDFLNGFDYKKIITPANPTTGDPEKITVYDSEILNSEKVLLPGESVEIIALDTTSQVFIKGTALPIQTSNVTGLEIVNNGTTSAYIVNYTNDSYYLKLKDEVTGSKFTQFDDDSNYSYYVGIVRPGQLINISMTKVVEIGTNDKITVSGAFATNLFNNKGWSTKALTALTNYFDMNKTQQVET